jgi:hypothetical protein
MIPVGRYRHARERETATGCTQLRFDKSCLKTGRIRTAPICAVSQCGADPTGILDALPKNRTC